AAVLSALDAKIDCNKRINAELEAMAKALYDCWFVQFDFPDANGKPYKSSGGKMVYNATLKREIPMGWEVSNLSDLVDLIKGNVSPSDVAENTPYVGLEHIGRKKITLSDWGTSDSAASDKTVFKRNDILFGKIRPYFHKVTVAPFDGITSTDTIIMRPKKVDFLGLALETVFADEFVEAATQSSTGSKMPRADWSVLRHYKIPVPDTDLLNSFNSVFEKALEKIYLSETENKKLIELRDWLLPLLMNGQVTVA
ncbi:MAG: restriction endonuclease subunit S, partial [Xanthomonadales bacterium]|nr:restriction endonuclease subunit S [Xanthomonadales bacterium]